MHEEIVNLHSYITKRKEISFDWEIFKYTNVYVNGEGDGEVVDTSTETVVNMRVPELTFVELIDLILYCSNNGYNERHYYTSCVEPFKNEGEGSRIWIYFDMKKEHTLFNKINPPEIMAIYYLAEFEKFIVMHIEKRKH